MIRTRLQQAAALLASAALAGCNLAPAYRPPAMAAAPSAFKEAPGWNLAAPSGPASPRPRP